MSKINFLVTLIFSGIFFSTTNASLVEAARTGEESILKRYLEEGADPLIPDSFTLDTPLHWAVRNTRLNIVKILVREIEFSDNVYSLMLKMILAENRSGETPLSIAEQKLNYVKSIVGEKLSLYGTTYYDKEQKIYNLLLAKRNYASSSCNLM